LIYYGKFIRYQPVYEGICKIWVKLKYYSLTMITTQAPTEEKEDVAKERIL
jgi:hypothetical protein